jgi:hypothetical protein
MATSGRVLDEQLAQWRVVLAEHAAISLVLAEHPTISHK